MKKPEFESVRSTAASLHNPKFGLFYLALFVISLAWPELLWAGGAILGITHDFGSQQSGGSGSGQQAAAPQPSPKWNRGQRPAACSAPTSQERRRQPSRQAATPESGDQSAPASK